MKRVALAALALVACTSDETLTAYGAGEQHWRLAEIDGTPAAVDAGLRFGRNGAFAARAPCAQLEGRVTVPYPWFEFEAAKTPLPCPDPATTADVLRTLAAMSLSEVAGDRLLLSTPEGRSMLFIRSGSAG